MTIYLLSLVILCRVYFCNHFSQGEGVNVSAMMQQHYDTAYRRLDAQVEAATLRPSAEPGTRPYPSRPKTRVGNCWGATSSLGLCHYIFSWFSFWLGKVPEFLFFGPSFRKPARKASSGGRRRPWRRHRNSGSYPNQKEKTWITEVPYSLLNIFLSKCQDFVTLDGIDDIILSFFSYSTQMKYCLTSVCDRLSVKMITYLTMFLVIRFVSLQWKFLWKS